MKVLLLAIISMIGIYFYARSRKSSDDSKSNKGRAGGAGSFDNDQPIKPGYNEELRNDEIN